MKAAENRGLSHPDFWRFPKKAVPLHRQKINY